MGFRVLGSRVWDFGVFDFFGSKVSRYNDSSKVLRGVRMPWLPEGGSGFLLGSRVST